ncbi:MAG: trans-2-enoyl-CoA reductase family protein [Abditibacteriales bacterium]|nr:trans-2-enoyl-CoA reductase family protein [Abditibacteriales bacterium]MDW8367742.1 trans-2-enoyl-CoA reductase family protein [Abditibacteriales bacterium]
MALTLISPRIRGFICTTAHPVGCARNVERQVEVARAARGAVPERYRVLVIGASAGYGLAARIAATWLYKAETLGVFFERPGEGTKTGTAGFYNVVAFQRLVRSENLKSINLNGDAFSSAMKEAVIAKIKAEMGQVDAVIYSLAAPRRTDPRTGEVYSATLKPVGAPYTGRTIDLTNETVTEITLPPATEQEIRGTIGVMGGDDLQLWTEALLDADALAEGVTVVPFSYIGPEITHPIYRSGTIGKAKEDLERTTAALNQLLHNRLGGRAYVSINKAVITQASSAIPIVPLYISLLYRIMKERGVHEEPIHQMVRLFREHIGPGQTPTLDEENRIRLDDRELAPDIQAEVRRLWNTITTDNLRTLTDYDGFKRGFRQLFGFEVEGVNYEEEVEVEATLD